MGTEILHDITNIIYKPYWKSKQLAKQIRDYNNLNLCSSYIACYIIMAATWIPRSGSKSID